MYEPTHNGRNGVICPYSSQWNKKLLWSQHHHGLSQSAEDPNVLGRKNICTNRETYNEAVPLLQIRAALKIFDDDAVDDAIKEMNRAWKIRPFLIKISETCLTLPHSEVACIDEQIISFYRTLHSKTAHSLETKSNILKMFVIPWDIYGFPFVSWGWNLPRRS